MSSPPQASTSSSPNPPPPTPPIPQPKTGLRSALEYTGIPPSWFEKRPKLPSRNWLIFIGVTSTLAGYYLYDRRECKRIREEYCGRVRYLSEEPLHSMGYPRKVTVYGAKWPDDDDWDRPMKYFRKYVKPILVAAAVDYEMIAGKRHGDLATRIANDIKLERRIAAGLEIPWQAKTNIPVMLQEAPEAKQRRRLEGGIILVGRPAFKEYMAGLRRGWTEPPVKVDLEEQLSRELENDHHFDEIEPAESAVSALASDTIADNGDEPIPTASRLPPSRPPAMFSPISIRGQNPSATPASEKKDPAADIPPPDRIPPQPPLLLVPFIDRIGISQIPIMIWDFFNERIKVKAGAEAAYRLVMNETEPFAAPLTPSELKTLPSDAPMPSEPVIASDSHAGHLSFDVEVEGLYKSSVTSIPAALEKARIKYYKDLPDKLKTARALAHHEREPTKDERIAPPPTEVELRAERLKKELRWRADERGWDIVRPDKPVEWDERMEGALHVFVDPKRTGREDEVEGGGASIL